MTSLQAPNFSNSLQTSLASSGETYLASCLSLPHSCVEKWISVHSAFIPDLLDAGVGMQDCR